jgi:hypothetical protein
MFLSDYFKKDVCELNLLLLVDLIVVVLSTFCNDSGRVTIPNFGLKSW